MFNILRICPTIFQRGQTISHSRQQCEPQFFPTLTHSGMSTTTGVVICSLEHMVHWEF